ncbi:hypothetical protein [Kordia sp.]|uniref:hypothetical protein n=1 Tax=Kordia sp. TaxID=1965332 RepID=UPI0025BF6A7F|nr:hypothetical protein [Kordia sp.]MCH2192904.1 hypothetical protein [Kordia sp.]
MYLQIKGDGYLIEYKYDLNNGELYKTIRYKIREKDAQIVSKQRVNVVEKFENGYRAHYFKNDTIKSIAVYTQYGDRCKHQDFKYNEETSCQYTYDTYGNWTLKTSFQNGIKTEKTTRTLEYY